MMLPEVLGRPMQTTLPFWLCLVQLSWFGASSIPLKRYSDCTGSHTTHKYYCLWAPLRAGPVFISSFCLLLSQLVIFGEINSSSGNCHLRTRTRTPAITWLNWKKKV
jgi:hypothetical protein